MDLLTFILGCICHTVLILLFEGVFLFAILYKILDGVAKNMTEKYNDQLFQFIIKNGYGDYIEYDDNHRLIFKEPLSILLNGCAIDEKEYLKLQKYMPYIYYIVLLFALFIGGLIIIIISRYLNRKIDYKSILITSSVVFLLICGYAFMVLYYVLTQPYILNIEADIYKSFLDVYDST